MSTTKNGQARPKRSALTQTVLELSRQRDVHARERAESMVRLMLVEIGEPPVVPIQPPLALHNPCETGECDCAESQPTRRRWWRWGK